MATQLDRVSPLTLYNMKRQYGGALKIYKLISSTTDIKTGQKVIDVLIYPVPRAVIFPDGYSRKRLPRFAFENRKWIAGGSSDQDQREFLVDRRDTVGLTSLTTDDWIIYKNRKYQIVKVESPEFDSCFYITARDIGEPPSGAVYTMTVEQHLDIDTAINVEVN